MTWSDIKKKLVGQQLEMDFVKVHGKTKPKLTPQDATACDLTFTGLGAGTNKRVLRVDGTNWVLAVGPNDSFVTKKSFEEEVATLLVIGVGDVRIPEPFNSARRANALVSASDYIFDVDIYDSDAGKEYKAPAFIQEYLTGAEMPKKVPEEKKNFMKSAVRQGGNLTPATLDVTRDDLLKIQARFLQRPWGDFQVFYDSTSGFLYVFDPLDSDTLVEKNKEVIAHWLTDLEP